MLDPHTALKALHKAMAAEVIKCVLKQGGLEEALMQLVARIGCDDITIVAELSPAGVVSLLQVWSTYAHLALGKALTRIKPSSIVTRPHAT